MALKQEDLDHLSDVGNPLVSEIIEALEEAKEIISKAELDAYCCNKWNREWLDKYFPRKP